MSRELLGQFHHAMLGIYDAGLKLKPIYRAVYFLRMVNEYGGKEAADRLLATGKPSKGFTDLWLRGPDALRLSVEYLVLQKPWRELFLPTQLEVARKRLVEYGCEPPAEVV